MTRTSIILAFATILLTYNAASQKTVRVQCQLVTTNICNSGYSYKVTSGTDYSEINCIEPGKVCDLSVNK